MLGSNSHAPFIAAARVANFTKHITAYGKDVETSYEAMKLERVGERMNAIAGAIEFQTKVATKANEMDKQSLAKFGEKLKALNDMADERYNARAFKELPPPPSEPIIDLTSTPMYT